MSETKPLISVIVPVYNSEKYLNRCLESILNQTLKDFELLLINDGSKDLSGQICDNYAKKDSRVKVYHKENGGVSSARNAGIERSSGKYLLFVDSDDYIQQNLFLSFSNILENNEYDLILYDFILKWKHTQKIVHENSTSISTLTQDVLECKVHGSVCNKLFNKRIFSDSGIRFNENISMGEDFLALFQISTHVKILYNLKISFYFYNQTNADSFTKNYSLKHINDIDKVFSIINHDPSITNNQLMNALMIGKLKKKIDLIYFSSKKNRDFALTLFPSIDYTRINISAFSFRDKIIINLYNKNKFRTLDFFIDSYKILSEIVQILKFRSF